MRRVRWRINTGFRSRKSQTVRISVLYRMAAMGMLCGGCGRARWSRARSCIWMALFWVHNGVIDFTIGQRRGLGIGGRKDADEGDGPLYVVGIDAAAHKVIVGPQAARAAMRPTLSEASWVAWMAHPPQALLCWRVCATRLLHCRQPFRRSMVNALSCVWTRRNLASPADRQLCFMT